MATTSYSSLQKRRQRSTMRLRQLNRTLPRLVVFRSRAQIYAQVVDDQTSRTIAHASSLGLTESGSKLARAAQVGAVIAQRALEANVTTVLFDRRGRKYHGRVKALADAAREQGLQF